MLKYRSDIDKFLLRCENYFIMSKITEADTRQQLIDKRLLSAGWDVSNVTQVSSELDIWVRIPDHFSKKITPYSGHQFADYALLGSDVYPLAVVEAKKTSKDARIGQEQALQYAQNIQKNSGKDMPFVFYTNGHDIYFWDTEKYPPRKVYGFPSKKDLERMLFLRKNEKPLSQELINRDIERRPYQIEAIRSVFKNLDKGKRKSLLVDGNGYRKNSNLCGNDGSTHAAQSTELETKFQALMQKAFRGEV